MPNENDPNVDKTVLILSDNWEPWGEDEKITHPPEIMEVLREYIQDALTKNPHGFPGLYRGADSIAQIVWGKGDKDLRWKVSELIRNFPDRPRNEFFDHWGTKLPKMYLWPDISKIVSHNKKVLEGSKSWVIDSCGSSE